MPWSPLHLAALSAGTALAVYLIGISLGRWLKRRAGVRLGIFFQLLCVAVAIQVPMAVFGLQYTAGWGLDARRELLAVLVLLGALFVIALLDRFLWDQYIERRRHVQVPKFLREVGALVLFVAVGLVVLKGIYGLALSGLLAGSGILAIILGFAMQDLLGNIISGIALEIGRPFRTGDWLRIDDRHGQVVDVNWRSIRLRTNDDICLDIPNNQIVRNTIINLTYPSRFHAMRLRVGIEYGAPPNTVKEILARAAEEASGVLKTPPPKAYLKEFGDSSINYEIKFFMDDHLLYNSTCDAIFTNVWYGLKRAGIRIPFPIRTLQIERPSREEDPREQAAAALRKQAIFACLDDEHVQQLARAARQHRYGKREKIIVQNTAGESMFVLIEGRAEVYVRTPAEEETLVASLRPCDCFGEMSLLTGEARSATVTAVTDCEVLEIRKAHFVELLEENPDLMKALGELLAARKMETEGVLASAASETEIVNRRREYSAGFLQKLTAYFGL